MFGNVKLQLGASFDQSLAGFVAGVLDEVLDETASQVLSLAVPLGNICIGVTGIQDSGINAGQSGGNLYWQRSAGIKEYRWQTMMDDRVRPLHADRQGLIFRWDKPPSDGHPGMAIRCRCVADPVIDLDDYGVEPRVRTYIYVD